MSSDEDTPYHALVNFCMDLCPGGMLPWYEAQMYPLIDALIAQAREEGRREGAAGKGCFEPLGDGTSKCAGCGFCVQGEPKILGKVTLPAKP